MTAEELFDDMMSIAKAALLTKPAFEPIKGLRNYGVGKIREFYDDARAEPLAVLKELTDKSVYNGIECIICGSGLSKGCAPSCVVRRAYALLAGAPEPTEQPMANAQREALDVLREFLECRKLGILIEMLPAERLDETLSEDPEGDSARLERVEDKAEALLAGASAPTEAKPIETELAELAAEVPEDEWDQVDTSRLCGSTPTEPTAEQAREAFVHIIQVLPCVCGSESYGGRHAGECPKRIGPPLIERIRAFDLAPLLTEPTLTFREALKAAHDAGGHVYDNMTEDEILVALGRKPEPRALRVTEPGAAVDGSTGDRA